MINRASKSGPVFASLRGIIFLFELRVKWPFWGAIMPSLWTLGEPKQEWVGGDKSSISSAFHPPSTLAHDVTIFGETQKGKPDTLMNFGARSFRQQVSLTWESRVGDLDLFSVSTAFSIFSFPFRFIFVAPYAVKKTPRSEREMREKWIMTVFFVTASCLFPVI